MGVPYGQAAAGAAGSAGHRQRGQITLFEHILRQAAKAGRVKTLPPLFDVESSIFLLAVAAQRNLFRQCGPDPGLGKTMAMIELDSEQVCYGFSLPLPLP